MPDSNHCRRCKKPEPMPNLSHIGNSLMSVYLCHPCHRELNDLVFAWLGDPVAPVIELFPKPHSLSDKPPTESPA